MALVQLPFGPQNSGAYTPADVERKRRLAEMLAGKDIVSQEPFGALAEGLIGARSGYESQQASEAERRGMEDYSSRLGAILADPNMTVAKLAEVAGDPWANQQQSAIVGELLGQKLAPPEPYKPDYQTFTTKEGDVMRFDNNADNAQPSMLYDAPEMAPEYRTLAAEEVSRLGLPAGSYQQGRDGKISSIGSGPMVQVNTGEGADSALDKSLSTKEGELWSTYKQAGSVSASNAQDFGVLDELIGFAPQGPIQGRLAEAFKGFSSAGDAFQSIVKRIAPTLRAPGSGATSDIEYQGMLDSLPSLVNNPAANAMILSIMKAKADINVQRSEVITRYQNGEISIGEARREMNRLDRASIITPEMRLALAGIGGKGEGPKEGTVEDGYRFKGGDPADPKNWEKV